MNEDVVERLDRLIGLIELGMREQLEGGRARVRAEPTYAAILEKTDKEISAGKLISSVASKTKQSDRTVKRRVAELIEMGAIRRTGAGNSVSYQATGLV
jgi:hypothetical protein